MRHGDKNTALTIVKDASHFGWSMVDNNQYLPYLASLLPAPSGIHIAQDKSGILEFFFPDGNKVCVTQWVGEPSPYESRTVTIATC
jgi:hypothetical protein